MGRFDRFRTAFAVIRPLCSLSIAIAFFYQAFVVTRSYFFRELAQPVGLFDESLQLMSGMFVKMGQRPAVDFVSQYPPLNYYLTAAFFRLMGESVITFRFYALVTLIPFLLAVGYHTYRRGYGLAISAAATWLACVVSGATLETFTTPAVSFALVALVAYLRSLEGDGTAEKVWAVIAGTALICACFNRLNFGLYAGVAIVGERAVALLRARRAGVPLRWPFSPFFVAPLALGAAIFLFVWRGHVGSYLDQMLLGPTKGAYRYAFNSSVHYQDAAGRRLILLQGFFFPVLPGVWLVARTLASRTKRKLLPIVVGLATAIVSLMLERHFGAADPTRMPVISALVTLPLFVVAYTHAALGRGELICLGMIGFSNHYFLGRPDPVHLLSLLPIASLLIPYAIPRSCSATKLLPALCLFVLCSPLVKERFRLLDLPDTASGEAIWNHRHDFLRRGDAEMATERSNPYVRQLYPDEDEVVAVAELRRRTAADEPVYIGIREHATHSLVNDARAYWLAHRPPAVRMVLLGNGFSTPPLAERQMGEDIETSGVRWILLWQGFYMQGWGLHLEFDSNHTLDTVIRGTFDKIYERGPFDILKRRPGLERRSRLFLRHGGVLPG